MPSNIQFNTIFQGVSPKPIRDAMASFAKDNKFDKIIMPCVGRFAGAEAIIRAGVAPSKIIPGDISLFSSVLGYYFADKDLSALKITSDFDFINPSSAPEFYAASILYGIKVCQAKDNTYYATQLKEALLKNPQARIQALASSLKELKKAMGGGIDYQLIDMNDMLDAWIDNENACIILSPPAYGAKGYVKMFDFKKHIQWDEPRIKQFGAKGDMEKPEGTGENKTYPECAKCGHNGQTTWCAHCIDGSRFEKGYRMPAKTKELQEMALKMGVR